MSRLTLIKYIALAAAIVLVISVFRPWVTIESRNIIVSGVDSTGTHFGKPGYFHVFMAVIYFILALTPRIWAKRLNLLITGLNMAWAIRNYLIISACSGGECPEKQPAFYLVLVGSALMLIGALFPDLKIETGEEEKNK